MESQAGPFSLSFSRVHRLRVIQTEPFFDRSQSAGKLRQARLNSYHSAKHPQLDCRRAANQSIIRQIVVDTGLGNYARAIANLNMVGAARLTPELTPLADFNRARQA